MKIQIFSFNLFQEHTMILHKSGPDCVVVDPGFYEPEEREEFFSWMKRNSVTPAAVLLTHGHLDHVNGVSETIEFAGKDIPVYMGKEDKVELEYDLVLSSKLGLRQPKVDFKYTDAKDGDVIESAGMKFKVISTPGHSPGSVCYLEEEEKVMFTGDTLFAGTIGRTDFKYSNYDDEIRSIMEKLIWLDGGITIYPGHGKSSTIGVERTSNPMLEPFNEKEELQQFG